MTNQLVGGIEPPKKEKAQLNIVVSKTEAAAFIVSGAIAAIFYSICFSGISVFPQLSFAVFCPVTFAVLAFTLKHLGLLKNKKALFWALPVIAVSMLNAVFSINLFTYGNVLVMHILFAVFTFSAMNEQHIDFSKSAHIIQIIFSNWLVFIASFQKLSFGKFDGKKFTMFKKVAFGIIIAFPVLLVVTMLLLSADMVLGYLTTEFINYLLSFEFIDLPFIFSVILTFMYFTGYVYQSKKLSSESYGISLPYIKADIVISSTFLTLLNFVFLLFSIVQVAYLFNGGFMTLPDGMVYSQYAREGFFQLLFVTVINFYVLVIFLTVLKGLNESKLIRILLISLCIFTGILIASSFYRMFLYIDVYGYTTLRMSVVTFLVMEVFLIIITFFKLFNGKASLIKWYTITGFVFYIIVNITGSNYFSTKLNVDMFLSGELDTISVYNISPDDASLVKPFFENDDYVCYDFLIHRKIGSEYKTFAPQSFSDIYQVETEENVSWQNWTYLKHKSNEQ